MSDTQTRLDAYKAAEARILASGQSIRYADRWLWQAELEQIRKAIVQLEAKLAAEVASLAGRGGLSFHTAVFCRK